jgi:hypothetical protein
MEEHGLCHIARAIPGTFVGVIGAPWGEFHAAAESCGIEPSVQISLRQFDVSRVGMPLAP